MVSNNTGAKDQELKMLETGADIVLNNQEAIEISSDLFIREMKGKVGEITSLNKDAETARPVNFDDLVSNSTGLQMLSDYVVPVLPPRKKGKRNANFFLIIYCWD
jgi:hypothetical protein